MCRGGCGKQLTDPDSVACGYGPVCYRKVFGHPRRTGGCTLAAVLGPVALFELPDAPAPDAPRPTAGERRRARIAEAVRRGYHPLGVALRVNIPLHADAAPLDDRQAPGLRCGACVHRVVPLRDVAGTYPKCNFGGDWRRATGGPGTDCCAYWPACKDYRPKEEP